MEFDYINDIHLDFWVPIDSNRIKMEDKIRTFAHSLVPDNPSKLLLIGGDLGHYNHQNHIFLDELSNIYQQILLVFGNHDYYLVSNNQKKKYRNDSINRKQEMLSLTSDYENIHYLDGNIIEIQGVRFGGVGMWYDFSFGIQNFGQTFELVRNIWWENSNDSRLINGLPFHTIEMFNREYEKLKSIYLDSDVLLTHVGPNVSLSPYQNEEVKHNSYYFFDGGNFTSTCKKIWCFGHVHVQCDELIDNHRFISNGLGYPDENVNTKFKKITI